jgi:ketosteroid isomerase-like protein
MIAQYLTQEQYLAIARDFYGKRARGEFEPGLALFHENATYRLLGSRALIPSAGVRVGKAEIREAWRAFDTDFQFLSFEVDDLVLEGMHTCYISWRMILRHRGTGATVDLECVDRLKWVDHKIVDYTHYFDTALVAALAERDAQD